ncbi:MAG: hypothetical protein N2037_11655 [Acidimicrobiales bacterium]|nr:hypothetical protein [Acidimicrobiales bacterium]
MTDYEDDDQFERRSARIERRDQAGSGASNTSAGPTEEQRTRAAQMRSLKASRRLLDDNGDDDDGEA